MKVARRAYSARGIQIDPASQSHERHPNLAHTGIIISIDKLLVIARLSGRIVRIWISSSFRSCHPSFETARLGQSERGKCIGGVMKGERSVLLDDHH